MPMDRKRAIETIEDNLAVWERLAARYDWERTDIDPEQLEAIKLLLSTAKLVEDVVGKVRRRLKDIDKILYKTTELIAIKDTLEYYLTLLTEGE